MSHASLLDLLTRTRDKTCLIKRVQYQNINLFIHYLILIIF